MRKTLLSIASLVFVTATVVSCGELTGPESPTTPTDVVATLASPTSVNLSWTPSPLNDGVISYSIYRNGNKVGETVGTEATYTDTGLSPQTTYVYSVAANCVGGVNSARSVETEASTVTTIDITPPTVIASQTTPPPGSSQVSPAADLNVTFSEPMDAATINSSTMTLRVTNGAAISGTVTYDAPTRKATFTPTSALPNFSSLTATITTGAKDLGGNALQAAYTWTFTTRDDVPPTITATSPANGATGVSPTAVITITFSEPMDAATINASNIALRTTSGTPVTSTVTYNANTRVATLTPSAPLTQNVNYTVNVGAGVRDAQGNAITATSFSFTAGDLTAPTVVSTVPADLATGVATNSTVSATFSEPMAPATINTTTFTVRPTSGGGNLAGTVTYSGATNTATFTPTAPLASGTSYTATVTTGATDAAGNPMGAAKTWTFVTADVVAPTVTAVVPANAATAVALNTTVRVTFSEPMNASTINTTTVTLRPTASATPVAATVTYDGVTNTAVLTPSAPLTATTNYTVTVTTGVRDVANNALAAQFVSTFTTLTPDVVAPTVTAVVPANLAVAVPTNTTVRVTFNEPMDVTTITNTNITVRNSGTNVQVAGTVSYDAATRVATFTPTAPLSNSTGYTITVSTAVKDASGNQLAAPFNSTFTTAAAADNTAPTIVSRTPTNGATSVAINVSPTVTFSEPMNPATITTSTITLAPTSGGSAVAAEVTYAGNVATLNPTADLLYNTSYTLTITTGVRDVAGNALAAQSTSTFTTILDTTAPTVTATSPIANATGVSRNTVITVTFSEAMDASTITSGANFTVTAGGAVAGLITYNAATRVATFTPSAQLAASTLHTVTITTGVKDAAAPANSMAVNASFSFTTGP